MPKIIRTGKQKSGFFCTCPAWRFSNPDPQTVYKAMLASVDVTATVMENDGVNIHFTAWTTPEHKYNIVYGPIEASGLCKHSICCASLIVGDWLQEGLAQAQAQDRKIESLKKEIKHLEKERDKDAL